MKECKAIKNYDALEIYPIIFLAGSIEMGKAEQWQKKVADMLKNDSGLLLNPRRDDWDTSWKQSIINTQFREQVNWELKGMEEADYIIMYFAPDTKSPISLLELGIFSQKKHTKLLVCCPDNFWRRGNVEIVCARYDVFMCDNLETLIGNLKTRIY